MSNGLIWGIIFYSFPLTILEDLLLFMDKLALHGPVRIHLTRDECNTFLAKRRDD